MKNKTIIFYDFEATGVSRDADSISLGMVAVTEKLLFSTRNGYTKDKYTTKIKTFYCEFTDFEIEKCDQWVRENIVDKLLFKTKESLTNARLKARSNLDNGIYKGSKEVISYELKHWLSQFEEIEFWGDFPIIDTSMLIDLIADWNTNLNENDDFESYKTGLPKHLPNIRYDQFFDLHTMLKLKGIDNDINKEEFVKNKLFELIETQNLQIPVVPFKIAGEKHNALWDSIVNWKVYEYLNQKNL